MEFLFEYDGNEYEVFLSDFTNRDKSEVIKIPYSDKKDDHIEYEIQVYQHKGVEVIRLNVMELSETLKTIIGEIIQKELDRTFIANPYFDEVLIFGSEVFTYQEQLVPINCTQCERRNLYEKRDRNNKTDFIKEIQTLLEEHKNPEWPFKEKLLLQFSVSNIQSNIEKVDLDNLAKTIFDTFKGVVYEEDNQIVSFAGDKNTVRNVKAFIIAIRRLSESERPHFQDYVFSGKMNSWQEERRQKQAQGKQTRFITFGEFKNK